MELAIKTEKLTKRYKDLIAVNSVDLQVNRGELFALLGENGAGKSTLIKMLCGLTKIDDGKAYLMDKSVNTESDLVKQFTNVCPQETAVAPNLTVGQNLRLIAGVYGLSKEKTANECERVTIALGLQDVVNKQAKKLSGGMKRRLSIAMALISNPKILFLDEPTLGLDVRARRELWQVILDLKKNTTIILTTHYLEEAKALADRIGVLNKGKLVKVGTFSELALATGKDDIEEIFLALTGDLCNE